MDANQLISTTKGFIFDLDGVIYKGELLIEGAPQSLEALKRSGKKYMFVTNHTKHTKADFITKLRNLGVPVEDNQLLTATNAVIDYLHQQEPNKPNLKIYLVGYGGIIEDFKKEGFELVQEGAEYVVIAWDPQFDYEKLYKAAKNIREGAKFIVSSPDRYIPSERGFELGFGTLGAAVEYATGVKATYVGKPYPPMINTALNMMGMQASEVVIVGDTPETDIKSQYLANLYGSILVLSGNITRDTSNTIPEDTKPTIILDSVKNLQDYLK
jgi:4-nitrophenyl phosphatase